MSRRQLVADGVANMRYRLRGASDAQSEALRDRIATSLEGVRVRDLERLGVRVMQRILPRLYPQMLTIAYDHQDAGRPVYIVTAAAQDMAEVLARVMTFDGALGSTLSEVEDGVYTGRPGRRLPLRRGEGGRDPRAGRARGHRPGCLLRLLGLGLRPADAARRRATRSSSTPMPGCARSPGTAVGRWCGSTGSAQADDRRRDRSGRDGERVPPPPSCGRRDRRIELPPARPSSVACRPSRSGASWVDVRPV